MNVEQCHVAAAITQTKPNDLVSVSCYRLHPSAPKVDFQSSIAYGLQKNAVGRDKFRQHLKTFMFASY